MTAEVPNHLDRACRRGRMKAGVGIAHETGVARDEVSMILAICAGEKKLFHELIQPYERTVYRMAFSVLRNEADAEDAAQDAFMNAYRKLGDFRMESRFGTWLISIVLNEARGHLRKRKRMPTESLDSSTEYGSGSPCVLADIRDLPLRRMTQQEIQAFIHRAIAQLPTIYRLVFQLRTLEEHPVCESAAMLGISEAVVKVRLHRARKLLQRHLTSGSGPGFLIDDMD